MVNKIKELKKWLVKNKQNFLTLFMAAPSAVSIVALLVQGFWFALTGDWMFPAQQLFIGLFTSLSWTFGLYKLWAFLKQINDAG